MSLVGLVIFAIAALIVVTAGSGMLGAFGSGTVMGGMMGGYYSGTGMMNGYSPWGMSGWGGFTWIWVPILAIAMGIGVLGVYFMNSVEVSNVRMGSVLVLVASVLAFPTAFGFIAGSLLMIIGAILGLTWSPATRKTS